MTCTVLRLQPVVGRDLDTPVTRLVRAPVVPTVLGYDPRVQLLDADDAMGALRQAVLHPVGGPVNIAADGVVSLSRALRHARRPALPIAGPVWGPLVAPRAAPSAGLRCPTRSGATCASVAASTPRACAAIWGSARGTRRSRRCERAEAS